MSDTLGRVTCGTCGKTIKFPLDKAGAAAKCPSCGEILRLIDSSTPTPKPAVSLEPPPVPASEPTTAPSPPAPKKSGRTETITVPAWAKPVAAGLVIFALGYFAGREHLKYQISAAFRDVGNAFATAFEDSSEQTSDSLRQKSLEAQAELQVAKLVIDNSMIVDGSIGPRSVVTFKMAQEWHEQDDNFKDRFRTILNTFWAELNPEEDPSSLNVVIE